VEQTMKDAIKEKRDAGRNALDPEKSAEQTKDWIARQLSHGSMEEFRKVLSGPAQAGRLTDELLTPMGTAEDILRKRQRILGKIGISDVSELPALAEAGRLTDRAFKLVRDNWKTLGMPYSLEHRAPGEAPLRDPRAALNEIQDAKRAGAVTSHIASLNHYLAEIGSGLFATHRNPAQAILRALVGHSRVIDLAHSDY